ncbi:hypothetical protein QFC22_006499 [Naganishia vaughanmartiniae]|uniref:Uncharacterized protein n=1 Tax=Naganishia vaughanmartiniae TaxID=1424756 RepID=A0ACC2WIK9_9TREE|nr:hypothetical protein QFC22_006499 [Naganishia vaughanmartiniae]
MNPHLPSGSIGSNPSEIRPDEVGTIEPPSHLTRKREAGHSPESPGDSLATGSPESVRTITSDDAAKIPLEENASHEPRFSRLTASQHCSDSRASDRASEWGDSDSQRSEVVSSGGAPSSSAAGEESTGSDSLNGRDVSGVNILHEKKGIFASGVIVNWHITVKLNVGRVVYEDAKTSLVPREIFCSDEWFVVNVVFSKGEITTATKPITKQVDQEMSDIGPYILKHLASAFETAESSSD